MTAARERVLALLADGMARPKGEAAQEAGVSVGVIDGLVDEGTLETLPLPPAPWRARPIPSIGSGPERAAAPGGRRLAGERDGRRLRVSLIDGVTGRARPRSISRGSRPRSSAAGRS